MPYEQNLVSVIIPAYNASDYIGRCMENVISQTYSDLEMIVVNDGSTDNTKNIISKYKKKDKRIMLINQENKGVAIARNLAIKNAKGRYIAFLDSDDLWK